DRKLFAAGRPLQREVPLAALLAAQIAPAAAIEEQLAPVCRESLRGPVGVTLARPRLQLSSRGTGLRLGRVGLRTPELGLVARCGLGRASAADEQQDDRKAPSHAPEYQSRTRSARRVFQRLGCPSASSQSTAMVPGYRVSSGQRPSASRF